MTGWIDKAKDFIKGHPEQAKDALQKAEDLINERTGGKYAEHVDQGSDAIGEHLGLPPDAEDAAPVPEPVPAPVPEPEPAPVPEAEPATTPASDEPAQGDTTLGDPPPARS